MGRWEGYFYETCINVFVILCEGEEEDEKCEENQAIFRNKYLKNYWNDFFQF